MHPASYRSNNIIINMIMVFICFFVFTSQSDCSEQNIKITVNGVGDKIRKNILLSLSIEHYKNDPVLTSSMIKRYHEKADGEIKKALQPFGYYNPVIKMKLTQDKTGWNAYYNIDPGRPVIINVINLSIKGEGVNNNRLKKIKKTFISKQGMPFNHQEYEAVKKSLMDTAIETGFISAVFTEAKVEVYPEKESAVITLHIDTGRKYYFGEITFIQNTFKEKFIKSFIPFKKREPYSGSGLLDLQNSFSNSDYFKNVEIVPLLNEKEGDEIPLKIKLIPREPNKYTFGFGFGTDTGLRTSAGWEKRILNDVGHRFKITLRISEIKSGISAEYFIPLKNPNTDNFIFKSGWEKENLPSGETEKYSEGVRYTHMRKAWNESMFLDFEQEIFELGGDSGISNLLIPGINWTYIRADNPMMVKKGLRFFVEIKGADENLLSSTSFIQMRAKLKYIKSFTSKNRILLRTEGGATSLKSFSDLPASVRFFAGGDNSVRGYGYNSIGPEDENGDVIGGKHLLTGSIELDHIIKNNWSTVVFYDIGNAINSFSDPLKKSTGFGVHWASPVGPVRLDIAFPVNDKESSWRIHLIIGPDI